MDTVGILADETDDELPDSILRTYAGYFNDLSLAIVCDIPFQRLQADNLAALGEVVKFDRPPAPLTDRQKIYVHEMTHLLQSVTTPVGLFLHRLQKMQDGIVETAVVRLVQDGITPKLPLIKFSQRLQGKALQYTRSASLDWLGLEAAGRWLRGDVPGTERTIGILKRWIDIPHPLLFFPAVVDAVREWWPNGLPNERGCGLPMLFSQPIAHEKSKDLKNLIAGEMLSPLGVVDIIEGMATASELWRSSWSLPQLKGYLAQRSTVQDRPYVICLEHALNRIPAKTLAEFVVTFLAAAELSLCGPWFDTIQGDEWHLPTLAPVSRLWWILGKSGTLPVISDIEDVPIYSDKVCEIMGWPNPAHQFEQQSRLDSYSFTIRERLFGRAQRMRQKRRAIFLDVDSVLYGVGTEANALHRDFGPPVAFYQDGMSVTDADRLDEHRAAFVRTRLLRSMMLGKSLAIPMPYPADRVELSALSAATREWFSVMFNLKLPPGFHVTTQRP